MKTNFLLSAIMLMAMMFLNSCVDEQSNITGLHSDDVTASLSETWIDQVLDDTIYMYCNQKITYTIGEETKNLYPNAQVKFWLKNDSITFGSEDDVIPKVVTDSEQSTTKGKLNVIKKEFDLDDGQIVYAEISYEIPTIELNDKEVELPHVKITDIDLLDATSEQLSIDNRQFVVHTTFNVKWLSSNALEETARSTQFYYIKTRSSVPDELIKTEYNKGYNWITDTGASCYVEKISTWSVSGTKRFKYSSGMLDFSIIKSQDSTIEATNLEFKASQTTKHSEKTTVSSNEWNIQKANIQKTIHYTNDIESFEDTFEYPVYDVSFTLDDQTFKFDIPSEAILNYQLKGEGSYAQNVSSISLNVLDKTLTADITTDINKKTTPSDEPDEPTPNPVPNPEPSPDPYNYGKVISYSATAVFDPSAVKTNGEITQKCICVRFEKGYLWGICEYEEALPKTFNYTVSGYTGFNSAAMDNTKSPYKPARAVDSNNGITWYAENNKIIAGIDNLTCMTIGWKNIVNGKYSAFIEGYSATYSSDKYTITITAPNGESVKFTSAKP